MQKDTVQEFLDQEPLFLLVKLETGEEIHDLSLRFRIEKNEILNFSSPPQLGEEDLVQRRIPLAQIVGLASRIWTTGD